MAAGKKTNLAKVALALLLAMMLSVFVSTNAFASSQDKPFEFTTVNASTQAMIDRAQTKENTSSIYCYIQRTNNSAVTHAYVNARGSNSGYISPSEQTNNQNWAYCNSAEPANRRMTVGTQYFIYNSVKENKYSWAALSFKTPKAVTMSGVWSPDSVPQSGVVQI